KLGEDLDGLYVGLPGYKLQITGGSDKDGFPMRHDLPGPRRKGLLVSGGVGFHPVRPGMRQEKSVRGNTRSPDILQVHLKVDVPAAYQNTEMCKTHNVKGELQRIVSFVDSPGHETLMATMLSGAAIMDGALLVIAANEDVPQPQTKEHLMALGIIGVNKIVIVQNKIDIVDPKQAEENYKQIQAFVKGTVAEGSPIVPVSAHHDVNLDVLLMMIQKVILTKADGLVGRVVGPPGTLPEVLLKMSVEVNLLERVVGVAEDLPVEGIKTSEPLMVSVGTATTVGVVTSARENRADMALKIPVVAELGQRVAVSRRIGGKWRLIGYGVIK